MKPAATLLSLLSVGALLALSVGCANDDVSQVVSSTPTVNASVPPTTTTTGASGTGLSVTNNAVAIGNGSAEDVASANNAADAVTGALSAGALDAASPDGGTIDDSAGSALVSGGGEAALSGWRERDGVSAGDVLMPIQTHAVVLAAAVTSATTNSVDVTVENGKLRVVKTGQIDITVTGVTVSRETTSGPVESITLSSNVQIYGTYQDGALTEQVDVTLTGLTGTISRGAADRGPDFTLTVGANGAKLAGNMGPVAGEVLVTGIAGPFTNLAGLNAELAAHTLHVQVSNVTVRQVLRGLTADVVAQGLVLPAGEAGHPVVQKLSGTLDARLDSRWAMTKEGRLTRVIAEVEPSTALQIDAAHDGPVAGTIKATLSYASLLTAHWTIVFQPDGKPTITGSITNASGQSEQVLTEGDTVKATGSVRYVDGRNTDHEVMVVRSGNGRKITFKIRLKNAGGTEILQVIGKVRANRGVQGTWVRVTPARNGQFTITPDGVLDLKDDAGTTIARVQLRAGWNAAL